METGFSIDLGVIEGAPGTPIRAERAAQSADAAGREAILVARAAADRRAFGELYRLHYRAIGGYLYRRTHGDRHAAEDLLSEVFLSALKGIAQYRPRGVPFRYWLLRIATNAANRWARRKRKLRVVLPLEAAGAAPVTASTAPSAPDGEVLAEVWRLSPKLQAVVMLHYVEDLAIEEVATVLGCRPGTVKSRLSRAREKLQTRLQNRR